MLTLTRIAFSYYVLVLCFYDCNISTFSPEGFSTLSKRLSPMFKTAFSNVQMFADLFKTCSPAVSLSIFMSIFAS
jgi:hypothetical protein